MTDIFLSYAREDLEVAKALVTALETQQWSVFWDRHIPAGKSWREVLGRVLADVECVVVVWSQSSVKSDWVLEEAEYGRGRHVLIPILIERVMPPLGFRHIQAADLSRWTGDNRDSSIQQFLQDVTSILKEVAERRTEEKKLQEAIAEVKRLAEEQQRQQAQSEARLRAEELERRRVSAEAISEPEAAREPTTVAIPQSARNIVLLSDGTGNSAAKLNRTNVWRIYQALDLSSDDQVAFYDDGIGTSGSRVLRLFGGGFGWGLSRSVRDLYEFLCRHYREGDHIYLFGFSRGAFTVRTLAALIAKCGVLDGSKAVPRRRGRSLQLNTHEGLKVGARLAYRSYRRGYKAPVAQAWRWLRDRFAAPVPSPDEFRSSYSFSEVTISFIGVWDTVDAVSLPVGGLSTLIDMVFYPHRFPDQDLSPRVERASHAISIDEERSSLRPVLWNERGVADSNRITQVWFSGTHLDVGGGYPENDLACVSLQWMLSQVKFDPTRGRGLRVDHDSLRAIEYRARPLGKIHASRRGLGSYQRYDPRYVASLSDDPGSGVLIAEPKIHQTVFDRIANDPEYSPSNLPRAYRIVWKDGVISEANPQIFESTADRHGRFDRLGRLDDRIQDAFSWLPVLHYAHVLVIFALFFIPLYRPAISGAWPTNWLETSVFSLVGWLPGILPGYLSATAAYWTDAWIQSDLWFLVLAIIYGWQFWQRGRIHGNIRRLREVAWWEVKRLRGPRPATPSIGFFERLAGLLRRNEPLQRVRRVMKWMIPIVKWMIAIVMLILASYIVSSAYYRIAFYLPAVAGGLCNRWLEANQRIREPTPWGPSVEFKTSSACVDTGFALDAGRSYRVEIQTADWWDGPYPTGLSGLKGSSYLFNPAFRVALPLRRHLTLPWFVLTGEIGLDSGYVFPIDRTSFTFEPRHSGRLYLYVNDAIGLGPDRYAFYHNNRGTGRITVTPAD